MSKIKIYHTPPPIYPALVKIFGVNFFRPGTLCIAYGDAIHTMQKTLPEDLIIHEQVHFKQQREHAGGVEGWWQEYIISEKFRLTQEVEAYRTQWKYLKENCPATYQSVMFDHIMRDLSGPTYGRIITPADVKVLIFC